LIEKEEIEKQLKIHFPIDKLGIIFGLASVLFLCTGVLYNELFLRQFGIQVSNYFTLSDYIASSIDHIFNLIIGLSGGVILEIITRQIEGENIEEIRKQSKFSYYFNKITYYFIIFTSVLGTIAVFYFNHPDRYYALCVLIIVILAHYSPKYFLKYFSNPGMVAVVFYSVFVFFAFTTATALSKAEILKNTTELTDRKYEIIFDNSMSLKSTNMVILTATSNYYFLYDIKERKTYIIPRQKIIRIDYKIE